MNALITISSAAIGGGEVQAVNARDLHTFLEVGKIFGAWIQERIEQYGFAENVDYVVLSVNDCFPVSESKGRGGHNRKEYHISLDMAKELAMVERNEKGKQARLYFIECERRARNPIAEMSRADILRLALDSEEKRAALEHQVAEQAPKVQVYDRICGADGSLCMRDAAKSLQSRPIDLKNFLVTCRWIYSRPGHSGYLAYQDKIQQGVLVHKVDTVKREDGSEKVVEQVRVTAKGLTRLAELLTKPEQRQMA